MIFAALPTHADPTYVAFANPFDRPLHFFGLELVVFACFALTLHHAVSRYRNGDRHHLFQWIVILAYGILMELLAFNYFQNYEHGLFSVQLYHRKLPLYVTCIYIVLHYTGLETVQRLRLGAAAEALVVGLAICLLDVPFDIVGVDATWWVWSVSDRDVAFRWLGVPVTSFYWYMLFGAIFALVCRGLRRRVERRSWIVYVAIAPLVGVAIIVLGIVGFLPFHGLEALGIGAGTIVLCHALVCIAIAFLARRDAPAPPSRIILFIPVALHAWHTIVLLLLWSRGGVPDAPAKLLQITVVSAVSFALAWLVPSVRRGRMPAKASPGPPMEAC